MTFQDLPRRLTTALILAGAFIALLAAAAYTCAGRGLLIGVAVIATAICAFEFAGMSQSPYGAEGRRSRPKGFLYFLLAMLPCLSVLLGLAALAEWCGTVEGPREGAYLAARGLVAAFIIGGILLAARAPAQLENARFVADDLFLGVYHIGMGGAALTWFAAASHGPSQLTWLFFITSLTDTAAYFGGSRFKGRKLSPVLSPNKTVSGALSGLAGGVLTGVIAGLLLGIPFSVLGLILASLAISAAGQAGDLMKSYLKRIYGVKDSGRIIPGHGGLYDRIDAALFAAPLALFFF